MLTLLSLLLLSMESPVTYDAMMTKLTALSASSRTHSKLHEMLNQMADEGKLPFIDGEKVIFIHRPRSNMPLKTVHWVGDFNRWHRLDAYKGKQLGTSDIWILTKTFPRDARLDYKLIEDSEAWLLDEDNPQRQLGGYGLNSQLAMPDWKPSPWVTPMDGVPKGKLEPYTVGSQVMKYDVTYQIYTPAGYTRFQDEELHTIYVTDGHEYAHPEMGSMVTVLDNLIARKKIPP